MVQINQRLYFQEIEGQRQINTIANSQPTNNLPERNLNIIIYNERLHHLKDDGVGRFADISADRISISADKFADKNTHKSTENKCENKSADKNVDEFTNKSIQTNTKRKSLKSKNISCSKSIKPKTSPCLRWNMIRTQVLQKDTSFKNAEKSPKQFAKKSPKKNNFLVKKDIIFVCEQG